MSRSSNGIAYKWRILSSIPCPYIDFSGSPIPINDTQFLIALDTPTDYKQYQQNLENIGIWKYDIIENDWTLFCNYPMNLLTCNHSTAFSFKKKLIIIHAESGHVILCNISNKSFQTAFPKASIPAESNRLSVLIGGKLHVICTDGHFVWNSKKKTFKMKHRCIQNGHYGIAYREVCRFHGIAYIQTKS